MRRLAFSIIFICGSLHAAAYYVDFASGSDAANGTSTSTPWKHCPGDANATGTAGAKTPAAGDTFNFKRGVNYKGMIQCLASGSLGNPITYQGQPTAWGTGKAIIDGSAVLSLSVCTGNGTGSGQVPNANFASIYYGTLPAGADYQVPVLESNVWLTLSQSATQPVPFFWKDASHFVTTGTVGATSTTDATRLTSSDSGFGVGAYIAMRSDPGNDLVASQITSFNTSTHTVSYLSVGAVHTDLYSIISEPRLLASAGHYAVDELRGLIFVWPTADSTAVTVGSLAYAFDTNGCSYITIDGFVTSGQYSQTYGSGRAISGSTGNTTDGVLVLNCDVKNNTTGGQQEASGAIYINGTGTTENAITSCTFSYIHGRGPFVTGNKIAVRNCEMSFIDGTCLYSQAAAAAQNINGEFSGNYIHDVSGVHQNGITIYGSSNYPAEAWIVANNRVLGMVNPYGNGGLTMQLHRNVIVYNNLIVADGGCPVDDLAAGSTYYRWYNNTVTVPAGTAGSNIAGVIRLYGLAHSTNIEFKNNLCNGLTVADAGSGSSVDWTRVTHTNNVYTALTAQQDVSFGWALGTGESTGTAAALFTVPASDTYTLKPGSAAIGTGANLSAYFTVDLSGTTRTVPWDMGAYSFVSPTAGNSPAFARPTGAFR